MVWRFNPASLASVDLKAANPGDLLRPLGGAADDELWLRLAHEGRTFPVLRIGGPKHFQVWDLQPGPQSVPTLVVAEANRLRIEIPEQKSFSAYQGNVGELIVGDQRAHVIAKSDESAGYVECSIDIKTWQIADHVSPRGSFKTWRIVDEVSATERRILLSLGDWSGQH